MDGMHCLLWAHALSIAARCLQGFEDGGVGQVWAQELCKIKHELTHIRSSPERHPRQVLPKQVPGGFDHQVFVKLGLNGHFSNNAHPHADAHIRFNHIGVNGLEGDVGHQVVFGKCRVDALSTREGGVVGDQRVGAELL